MLAHRHHIAKKSKRYDITVETSIKRQKKIFRYVLDPKNKGANVKRERDRERERENERDIRYSRVSPVLWIPP